MIIFSWTMESFQRYTNPVMDTTVTLIKLIRKKIKLHEYKVPFSQGEVMGTAFIAFTLTY